MFLRGVIHTLRAMAASAGPSCLNEWNCLPIPKARSRYAFFGTARIALFIELQLIGSSQVTNSRQIRRCLQAPNGTHVASPVSAMRGCNVGRESLAE
jgi:hypothetical protein